MKKNFVSAGIFLLAAIFISLLFYGNYQYVRAQPGGTDFLYRWLPTRLVLFEGFSNPYSAEAEYRVELMHHGHAHQEDETPGIFAYPYYTMAVILPFAFIEDFIIARAAWMTMMELAHAAIIFLTLRILAFKPSALLFTSLTLFALLNADFAQALIDGNPSSLAALFAVLSLYFLLRKADIWAGIFLALSTIKPQLVILFFILVYLWAFFQKRWSVILSSALALLFLFAVSFALQPDWVLEFIKDLRTYPGVARPSTPRAILAYWMPAALARGIALGLSLLSAGFLLWVWRDAARKDFPALFWAACITFTIMPFTGITSAKSNYIAMVPGVILLIQYWGAKFQRADFIFSASLLTWILLSWLFFFAGRNLVIGGNLIYFLDFYPMPILLMTFYGLAKFR